MRLSSQLVIVLAVATPAISTCGRALGADSKDDKTSIVIAEGVGKDEKEARKAAFRDAVSRVVGTLIDAQTLVKNDEIISERILEYSGGFIKSYDVLKSEKTDGGLVRVRIKATVERVQLVGKLADAKVTIKEVKGTDLLAEKMTKEEARKNATELLAKLFEDLPKCLQAEAVGKPRLNDNNDAVLIDFALGVDQKKYGEFVKKAMPLLEKLAIAKDSVLLPAQPHKQEREIMAYGPDQASLFETKPELGDLTPKGWAIWLCTYVDSRFERARWNLYWIDSDVASSLKPILGKKVFHLSLTDEKDQTVTKDNFDASKRMLSMDLCFTIFERGYTNNSGKTASVLIISPFAIHQTYRTFNYRTKISLQRTIKLTDKELEKIKNIKASIRVDAKDEKFNTRP